jgi:hypothetical protein
VEVSQSQLSGGLHVSLQVSAARRPWRRPSRAATIAASAALLTDALGTCVELCQDASGFCVEAPRPNPAAPISSVPDNFTPDEEGYWWLADATVPNAGRGLARFDKEAAFDTPGINQGHQIEFSRIRFRFDGIVVGATYRVTHPYGVDEIAAEPDPKGGGLINVTEDVGCLAAPCGTFPALSSERVTSFASTTTRRTPRTT